MKNLKPWLAHRSRRKKVTTIVLHATAGSSIEGAVSTLRQRGLSYHFLIEDNRSGRDGQVTKCVPLDSEAFHAGVSKGPNGGSVNHYSIGVCFVNLNNGADPYSEKQFLAAKSLIVELLDAYPALEWLTTHYWVSPGRKTDPRGFDVLRLAEETGMKVWDGGRPVLK